MDSKVPIIDLSSLAGPYGAIQDNNYADVLDKLGHAMENVGFAYLINHGVDMEKVNSLYKTTQNFFVLPKETKAKYKKQNLPYNFHGYAGPGDELLNESNKNSTELREFWDIWGPLQYKAEGFPTETKGFKECFDSVRPELNNLGKKLLKCIAKYLKMEDEDFFIKRHTNLDDPEVKTQTQMRTIWYYTIDQKDKIPENAIRCGEHSDWGSITLLFQDEVGGLEVKNVLGEWIKATPIKDAILLNSGQLMELWTGGHIYAAPHRVRVITNGLPSQKPRQSFIQFINPDAGELVRPVLPVRKGKEYLAQKPLIEAYSHYERLIADATLNGYSNTE